ncbi:MAG TPA: hypothetical protein VFM45_08805, partial [Anaeromyxobacteraceae bacterium]|nr:hypothetical protein [Anaeromyxobacteraceae bacterium]
MIRAELARRVQTREALRDALAAVKGYPGATGDITMGPDRTPQKALFLLMVDPKVGLRELGPDELAGLHPGGQP